MSAPRKGSVPMNPARMFFLLIVATAAGIGAGAGHLALDAIDGARGEAVVDAGLHRDALEGEASGSEGSISGAPGREVDGLDRPDFDAGDGPLPAFLTDDEQIHTQLQQLRLYYGHEDVEQIWERHVRQIMEARGVTAAGIDRLSDVDDATPEEIEAFRQQLGDYMTDLDDLLAQFPEEQVLDGRERLADAQTLLEDLDETQAVWMMEALSEYPGYWELPGEMQDILNGPVGVDPLLLPGDGPSVPGLPPLQPEGRPTVPVGVDVPDVEGCAEFGDDPTCAECPPEPAGGIIPIFALETAALATNTTCEFLPPKILAGTTDIPNPANIICVSVRVAIELAAAAVELAKALHDECEDNYHRSITFWYLDETVMSRTSQKSHDFHNLWTLRIAIENNLLMEEDSRISLFQLPESEGGLLDASTGVSVRDIVRDTIDMNVAAGYDVRNAEDEWEAAEIHLGNGEYKSAYARYRLAYRAAVRVSRILPTPVP